MGKELKIDLGSQREIEQEGMQKNLLNKFLVNLFMIPAIKNYWIRNFNVL